MAAWQSVYSPSFAGWNNCMELVLLGCGEGSQSGDEEAASW